MKPEGESKGLPNTFSLVVTILTHLLLVAPVIYIVVLYSDNYNFFSWHPICMSIGVGLLILEGVFSISGEANLGHRLSRANRVTTHWILHTVGLSLMFTGLTIIVIHKNQFNREHFSTLHGILGLSSIIIASFVALFGILANNTRWLYPKVRPILIKVGHAFGGITITILFLITIINGTLKASFPGSSTGQTLLIISFILAAILILFKPILGAIARTKVLLRPSQQHNQAT